MIRAAPDTRTPVGAGLARAVVYQDVAHRSGEARGTTAGVTSLARIEASSSVATGLVVRAEVEILVAEQASPSFVTEAIPRLNATAVHATRITLASIAKRPFPTRLAPATTKTHHVERGRAARRNLFALVRVNDCRKRCDMGNWSESVGKICMEKDVSCGSR